MKLSTKFTFIIGLLMIIFSGTSILLIHPGFALKLMKFAFWILSLATVQYLWEIRKNAK